MKNKRRISIDLTNKKFGKLLVLNRDYEKVDKQIYWICKCDCGNILSIRGSHLKGGQIQCKKCMPHNYGLKHGLHSHPSYRIWVMMKQRCDNPKSVGYHNYGGRGIKVCKRWYDFSLFAQDVGVPPTKYHTLDRINNNGNYEPSNFRWATVKEQCRNKRNNRLIKYNNIELSISEWAERLGMRHDTIAARLRRGWSINDTLTKKLKIKTHK